MTVGRTRNSVHSSMNSGPGCCRPTTRGTPFGIGDSKLPLSEASLIPEPRTYGVDKGRVRYRILKSGTHRHSASEV